MNPRYPAPSAEALFNDTAKMESWRTITDLFLTHHVRREFAEGNAAKDLLEAIARTATPSASAVREKERETGHDVVAFLALYEALLPAQVRPYLHYGLTSSDVVDPAHFNMLAKHAGAMLHLLQRLKGELSRWSGSRIPRLARTHGQIADVTTWQHQVYVIRETVDQIARDLTGWVSRYQRILKTPGPSGNTPVLRNTGLRGNLEGWTFEAGTQVIPRDAQLQWASIYVRMAAQADVIATLVRSGARQEIGELAEGVRRVGSSSMPTKRNPIQSERISGMARVARGHWVAIAESVALWDDRDISNSVVERTAVPDLAATVEFMMIQAADVLKHLEVNKERMRDNLEASHDSAAHYMQAAMQKYLQVGPVEASDIVRRVFNPAAGLVDAKKLLALGYAKEDVGLVLNEVRYMQDFATPDMPKPRVSY